MRIEIGGVGYEVSMVPREILHPHDGRPCNGLTWPDKALIEVDGRLPAAIRRKTAWHEVGHAFKCELDIHDAEQLGEEAFCNLVALALSQIHPKLYLRLWVYATRLIDCHEVALFPGMSEPMPVFRTPDEPPEVRMHA